MVIKHYIDVLYGNTGDIYIYIEQNVIEIMSAAAQSLITSREKMTFKILKIASESKR